MRHETLRYEGLIPFVWRRWRGWVIGVGVVLTLTVVGVVFSRRDRSVEQIIGKQLGRHVTDCVKTGATGKFTCDLNGGPHCYVFDMNLDQAAEVEEGRASYSDFRVRDYGSPVSSLGC